MHIACHIYVALYDGSTEYEYRGCPSTRLTTCNSILEYLYYVLRSTPTVGTSRVDSARFPGDWYLLKKPQLTLRTAPFHPKGNHSKSSIHATLVTESGLARSPEIPLCRRLH